MAKNEGWDLENLNFEVINNLTGAIEGLTSGEADYFMWEYFTTKPLVDKGIFRRLGDCPTPWPCFMLVGTDAFISENGGTLKHILEIINLYTDEFKNIPSIDRTLANRYEQKLEDIQEWLGITKWSQQQLPVTSLEEIQDTLLSLKLISQKLPANKLLR